LTSTIIVALFAFLSRGRRLEQAGYPGFDAVACFQPAGAQWAGFDRQTAIPAAPRKRPRGGDVAGENKALRYPRNGILGRLREKTKRLQRERWLTQTTAFRARAG
jgi:hypothetical protein